MYSKKDFTTAGRIALVHNRAAFKNNTSFADETLARPDASLRDIWRSAAAYAFSGVEFVLGLSFETAHNARYFARDAQTPAQPPRKRDVVIDTVLKKSEGLLDTGLKQVRRTRIKANIPYTFK